MHSAGYVYIIFCLLIVILIGSEPISTSDSSAQSSLDHLLQVYAFRELTWPRIRTRVPYDADVPSNLTGIKISALILTRFSLKWRGYGYFKEFYLPSGIVEDPYAWKLVMVYQNLGNWSTFYYPLPGYIHLTPVLGILAYNACNMCAKSIPILDILALEEPITVRFPYVKPAPEGSLPKCVYFYLDQWVEFGNVTDGNICLTRKQGHFSIVAEVKVAPSPSPSADEITAPTPSPSSDEIIAPSPSPSSDRRIAPSPSPSADTRITPSPSPSSDRRIAPSPPSADTRITPSPSPSADTRITPSPSPSADTIIAPSPSPSSDRRIAPSPSPSADTTIAPSPSPSADTRIAPSPSPSADTRIAPSPSPSADTIIPPSPSDEIIAPSPSPTADENDHQKTSSKMWTISSGVVIVAFFGILFVIVKKFGLLEIRQMVDDSASIVRPLLENTEAPMPLEAPTRSLLENFSNGRSS